FNPFRGGFKRTFTSLIMCTRGRTSGDLRSPILTFCRPPHTTATLGRCSISFSPRKALFVARYFVPFFSTQLPRQHLYLFLSAQLRIIERRPKVADVCSLPKPNVDFFCL